MTFWKTFWASLLASVASGVLVLVLFFVILNAMIAGFGSAFESKKLTVEENTVLRMEFNTQVGDYSYANFDPATLQFKKQLGLNDILAGIERAKTDDKIKGIFLNCDGLNMGMATIKEIRDALADFNESGKFLVSYNENYDKKAYYLSSVAQELYVYKTGLLEFLGLGAELMFLKGALEKLDVDMQIIRGSNNRFKSAVEPLIYDHMSDANRLQTQKYIDALWDEVLSAVSKSRNITKAKLNEIADSVSVRKGADAVQFKMADATKYYDEILDLLEEKCELGEDEEMNLLSFEKYALKKAKEEKTLKKLDKKNIAVIFAEGEIVDGAGEIGQIGGTSLSEQIREARLDEDIKGIVLRINSPGGSALASDVIWREVMLTKEAKKPIVVSMGDIAASGGYYIACAADTIYAQPNTITGSIGVFGIIPYTGDLFQNKLGITFDRVQTNEHSILSLNRRLTEDELAIIQESIDGTYDEFLSKVADGRGLKKSDVDSIGQGRVWAGTDAKEIGLVDAFGGLWDAIYDVAGRADVPQDSIVLEYYPKSEDNELLELMELLDDPQLSATVATSPLETQIMDIYFYLKSIGSQDQVQARLPYLYWID